MGSELAGVRLPRLVADLLENSRARRAAAVEKADEIREAQQALVRRAAEARTANAVRHLEACGVDPLTREPFASPPLRGTAALREARAWLEVTCRVRPFLILATEGGYGAGKSVAAAYCLLRATRVVRTLAHPLADEETEVEELDASRGLWLRAIEIKTASRYAQGTERPLLDRAAMVRWLVVDELREVDCKGAGQERLEEVLSERYARHRPTVITSNLGQARLAQLLGGRLASRLAEGAVVVDPGQVDLRREKK